MELDGTHGCLMEEELFEFLVNMPGLLNDESVDDYYGKKTFLKNMTNSIREA